MLAAWFAQLDMPLDPSAPNDLRTLLDVSLVLVPVGLLVGIVGHLAGSRPVVAIGIGLVMLGSAVMMVAVAGYG